MLFKSEGSVDRACFLGQRMLLTRLYSEFLEQLVTVFFVFGGFFQVSDPVSLGQKEGQSGASFFSSFFATFFTVLYHISDCCAHVHFPPFISIFLVIFF